MKTAIVFNAFFCVKYRVRNDKSTSLLIQMVLCFGRVANGWKHIQM